MAGWNSSFAVSKTGTLKAEGWYLVDETTGARNGGQFLAEVAANVLGPAGFRYMRVRARDTADTTDIGSITIQASLKMSQPLGGGQDDVQPWGIEAMAQGKPTGSGIYAVFS